MISLQVGYTNCKTVDQGKSKFTKQEDSSANVTGFVWIRPHCLFLLLQPGRPHSYSTGPHQVCRFSFVACQDVHRLLFVIFEWMDHLVVDDDACYIIHPLFSACLWVSSWCLVSFRSKCVIAFVCSHSAVRTVRARQYFTMVASWSVESLVLASLLYVFSNVMSLQTQLN